MVECHLFALWDVDASAVHHVASIDANEVPLAKVSTVILWELTGLSC